MKKQKLLIVSLGLFSTLMVGALFFKAQSFDDFKLRHFSLTQHLNDQSLKLVDIQGSGVNSKKNSRIDLNDIFNGGPPQDGIPSIDQPEFDTAANTPFSREELVIGLVINGEAKAYPLGIMNWHEIVNDTVGGKTSQFLTVLSVTPLLPLTDNKVLLGYRESFIKVVC